MFWSDWDMVPTNGQPEKLGVWHMDKNRVEWALRLAALLPLLASVFLPTVAQAQKTAYVMIGLSSTPSDYRSTALAVVERYKNAGYNVVFLNGVTRDGFQKAVDDPNTSVIWYLGHGQIGADGYEEGVSVVGPDPYNPGKQTDMMMSDADLTVPANSNIQEVVFHACGQNLPSWDSKFPHATFESWSRGTNGFLIDDWELYFHTIFLADFIPPSTPPIIMDPRIRPNNNPVLTLADGNMAVPLAYTDWQLSGLLLSEFGNDRTFNFYTSGGGLPNPQWLFSGEVLGGSLIAGSFTSPFAAPSYSFTMNNDSLLSAYMNRDVWPDLLTSGAVTIQVNDANLDPSVAFEATGSLLLGLNGAQEIITPEPPPLFLIGLSLFGFVWWPSGARKRWGFRQAGV